MDSFVIFGSMSSLILAGFSQYVLLLNQQYQLGCLPNLLQPSYCSAAAINRRAHPLDSCFIASSFSTHIFSFCAAAVVAADEAVFAWTSPIHTNETIECALATGTLLPSGVHQEQVYCLAAHCLLI